MPLTRPLLVSSVRPNLVNEDHGESMQSAYEEAQENLDMSVEMEGSCDLMSEAELSIYKVSEDKANRNNDLLRRKRVIKKWLDSRVEKCEE